MEQDEVKRKAEQLGLVRLADRHADDLEKALKNAEILSERLPKDLHWTEEPAHTYRLSSTRGRR